MRKIVAALAIAVALVFVATFGSAGGGTAEAAGAWTGVVAGDSPNIRSAPSTEASIVGTLHTGDPIQIQAWVHGEMVEEVNETWGEIAPGEYVYSAELAKPLPSAPPPPPQTFSGHWIDVNLTQQIITAYDGDQPEFLAVMSAGAPGTPTETGVHQIERRVADETMDSSTLLMQVEVPYYLTDVLYTQYFTDYGEAIHDNYWKDATSPYGVPTSHGCIGLREPDALRFWNWTSAGTIVNIHD